jgi:Lar family restriction alleviation protein
MKDDHCPLLPCPFCGQPATHGESYRGGELHAHFVACSNTTDCHMATPWRTNKADAVAIWNRRTPAAA